MSCTVSSWCSCFFILPHHLTFVATPRLVSFAKIDLLSLSFLIFFFLTLSVSSRSGIKSHVYFNNPLFADTVTIEHGALTFLRLFMRSFTQDDGLLHPGRICSNIYPHYISVQLSIRQGSLFSLTVSILLFAARENVS